MKRLYETTSILPFGFMVATFILQIRAIGKNTISEREKEKGSANNKY
jgi:hypothetical protein